MYIPLIGMRDKFNGRCYLLDHGYDLPDESSQVSTRVPRCQRLRPLSGGDPLAARLLLPKMRLCWRAIPFCNPLVGRVTLPRLQKEHVPPPRHGYAVEPYAPLDLVLGRLSHDDADARPVRRPISAPA